MLDSRGGLLGLVEDFGLGSGNDHVGHGDRRAGAAGPVEARGLERVERGADGHLFIALGQGVDNASEDLLVHSLVDVREIDRERLVERRPAQARLQGDGVAGLPALWGAPVGRGDDVALEADLALRVEVQLPQIVGHPGFGH